MKLTRRKRNSKLLWGLVFLAVVFNSVLYIHPSLTGIDEVNGLLGVSVGLFISSLPSANFLDMILYDHVFHQWHSLKRPDIYWLLLNMGVWMIGLIVVAVGMKLFFRNWL